MQRLITLTILGMTLAGCAQDSALRPSYLGLGHAVADDDDEAALEANLDPVLNRIPSNKVLGAMAFQKVTGRAVDPSRLSAGR